MTREEAMNVLKANYPDPGFSDLRKAVDMAIKVLKEPEPCEDAVSREMVSEWLKQYGQDVLHGKYKFSLMYIWKNLMDLPSVQPESQWIPCKESMPAKDGTYLVSGRWASGKESVGDCDYSKEDGYFHTVWNFDVLAWRELPEPYKERRKE